MRSYIFHSFVCLAFTLLLIISGLGLCCIYSIPYFNYHASEYLHNHPAIIFEIGLLLALFGSAFLFLFYIFNRKSYYQVELERSLSYVLHHKMIEKSVKEFLKQEYPQRKIPFQVLVFGQKIEILTDLSKISFEDHEQILKNMELKLARNIEVMFGEPKELTLSVFCARA